MTTVREATYDVLRLRGMTTMFANPGSTEVSFLAGLPGDVDFVLGLHEGSVVGMATGYALTTDEPALVLLHTTAGFGNAVGALATARVNRAPLVVIVGQQDRRHLALEPFLAGRLDGLAGQYPVWFHTPLRPDDVPGAIDRAYHEAITGRGPAVVVVPMDDWDAEIGEPFLASPVRILRGVRPDPSDVEHVAALIDAAAAPCLVVGADADEPVTWDALGRLADRISCPVFQEAFGARAGFPQDHQAFAGHLPARRTELRSVLSPYDLVVVVGGPVFRQYPYDKGPLVPAGTKVVAITADPEEAHRSPADLVVLAPPAAWLGELADAVSARTPQPSRARTTDAVPADVRRDVLSPRMALELLGERLSSETVVLEESPSSRPILHRVLPARANLGFLSAAMGGLGFALPASIGVRLAAPQRPVVAVVGDGSSLYNIQSLWSASHYGAGVLVVILANGGYAIMDRLSEQAGAEEPAWPGFRDIDFVQLAGALGCESVAIRGPEAWTSFLDEIAPTLGKRMDPIVAVVEVSADSDYRP